MGVGARFERVEGLRASGSVWQVLGMPLVAGRAFTQAEDTVGGPLVVILSEGVWRARFAAGPNLLGRAIPVNGESRTVVGIAPQGVGFATNIDVWLPINLDPKTYGRGDRRWKVLGRLQHGVTLAQARAELDGISRALAVEFRTPTAAGLARWKPRVPGLSGAKCVPGWSC